MEKSPKVFRNHGGKTAIEIGFPMDFIARSKKPGEFDRMTTFHAQHICVALVPIPFESDGTYRLRQNVRRRDERGKRIH